MARKVKVVKSKAATKGIAKRLVEKQIELDRMGVEIKELQSELLHHLKVGGRVAATVDEIEYNVQRIDPERDELHPPAVVHDRMDDPDDFYLVVRFNSNQLKSQVGEKEYYRRFVKETHKGKPYIKVTRLKSNKR